MSDNPKPLDAPWTVHDVGDLVGPRGFASDRVRYGYGNDEDVLNNMVSQQLTWKIIWNHVKTLLFYSGDTGDHIKPAEEWGEKE
jgi:hypothetical protein